MSDNQVPMQALLFSTIGPGQVLGSETAQELLVLLAWIQIPTILMPETFGLCCIQSPVLVV